MWDRRDIAIVLALVSRLLLASPADAAVPDPADDPSKVVLSDLRPRLGQAARDLGKPYTSGCHVAVEVTTPSRCRYGQRDGSTVVVVLGDSIVAQWWAAIQRTAMKAGWRIVWMTKSGCPAADVTILIEGSPYAECDTWRRNALAMIRQMKQVDLVVVGGSSRNALLSRVDGSMIPDGALRAAEWQAGYQRTVEALAGEVGRVAILRDTPAFRASAPHCLKTHVGRTTPCSRDRASALAARLWQAEQAVAARYDWVRTIDMTARICRNATCWPVTSNRILRYRDDHHLTNTFARALAPALAGRFQRVIR